MADNQRVSDEKNLETRREQSRVIHEQQEDIVGLRAELEDKEAMSASMADKLEEKNREIEDLRLRGSESEPWVR